MSYDGIDTGNSIIVPEDLFDKFTEKTLMNVSNDEWNYEERRIEKNNIKTSDENVRKSKSDDKRKIKNNEGSKVMKTDSEVMITKDSVKIPIIGNKSVKNTNDNKKIRETKDSDVIFIVNNGSDTKNLNDIIKNISKAEDRISKKYKNVTKLNTYSKKNPIIDKNLNKRTETSIFDTEKSDFNNDNDNDNNEPVINKKINVVSVIIKKPNNEIIVPIDSKKTCDAPDDNKKTNIFIDDQSNVPVEDNIIDLTKISNVTKKTKKIPIIIKSNNSIPTKPNDSDPKPMSSKSNKHVDLNNKEEKKMYDEYLQKKIMDDTERYQLYCDFTSTIEFINVEEGKIHYLVKVRNRSTLAEEKFEVDLQINKIYNNIKKAENKIHEIVKKTKNDLNFPSYISVKMDKILPGILERIKNIKCDETKSSNKIETEPLNTETNETTPETINDHDYVKNNEPIQKQNPPKEKTVKNITTYTLLSNYDYKLNVNNKQNKKNIGKITKKTRDNGIDYKNIFNDDININCQNYDNEIKTDKNVKRYGNKNKGYVQKNTNSHVHKNVFDTEMNTNDSPSTGNVTVRNDDLTDHSLTNDLTETTDDLEIRIITDDYQLPTENMSPMIVLEEEIDNNFYETVVKQKNNRSVNKPEEESSSKKKVEEVIILEIKEGVQNNVEVIEDGVVNNVEVVEDGVVNNVEVLEDGVINNVEIMEDGVINNVEVVEDSVINDVEVVEEVVINNEVIEDGVKNDKEVTKDGVKNDTEVTKDGVLNNEKVIKNKKVLKDVVINEEVINKNKYVKNKEVMKDGVEKPSTITKSKSKVMKIDNINLIKRSSKLKVIKPVQRQVSVPKIRNNFEVMNNKMTDLVEKIVKDEDIMKKRKSNDTNDESESKKMSVEHETITKNKMASTENKTNMEVSDENNQIINHPVVPQNSNKSKEQKSEVMKNKLNAIIGNLGNLLEEFEVKEDESVKDTVEGDDLIKVIHTEIEMLKDKIEKKFKIDVIKDEIDVIKDKIGETIKSEMMHKMEAKKDEVKEVRKDEDDVRNEMEVQKDEEEVRNKMEVEKDEVRNKMEVEKDEKEEVKNKMEVVRNESVVINDEPETKIKMVDVNNTLEMFNKMEVINVEKRIEGFMKKIIEIENKMSEFGNKMASNANLIAGVGNKMAASENQNDDVRNKMVDTTIQTEFENNTVVNENKMMDNTRNKTVSPETSKNKINIISNDPVNINKNLFIISGKSGKPITLKPKNPVYLTKDNFLSPDKTNPLNDLNKIKRPVKIIKNTAVGPDYTPIYTDNCTQTDSFNYTDTGIQTETFNEPITNNDFDEVPNLMDLVQYILATPKYSSDLDEQRKTDLLDMSRNITEASKLKNTTAMRDNNTKMMLKRQLIMDLHNCVNYDYSGNMLIHNAVLDNNMKMLARQIFVLSIRNISVNVQNSNGYVPIQLAIMNNSDINIIEKLLDSGADTNVIDDNGNNLLHLILIHSTSSVLNEVLAKCKNFEIIDTTNDDGLTPLMLGAIEKKNDLVEILLEAGANPNIRDEKSGRTALFHAVENDADYIINLLLRYKADPKLNNFLGVSPIEAARDLPCGKTLLQAEEIVESNLGIGTKRPRRQRNSQSKKSKITFVTSLQKIDPKLLGERRRQSPKKK